MKNMQMKCFFVFLVLSFVFFEEGMGMKVHGDHSSHGGHLAHNHNHHGHKENTNMVIDNGASPLTLNHVVRRNPTVTYKEKISAKPTVTGGDSSMVSFGNSNSNNSGGSSLGASVAIVGPSIVLHNHGTMSAVKETPAHVGWRREQKTVTSLNKGTGQVEQHVMESKEPLIGVVQEVKTLKTHTSRKYDINSNKLGPISTSISE
jgi:hypothetical protein